jgi:hypothetical protein
MKRMMLALAAAGSLAAAMGCATVTSISTPNTNMAGDAWYTQDKTLMGFFNTETHVYYCPKPTGVTPAQCVEAKYVEGAGAGH